MRVREKNNFLSFLKAIFIDVDYPDGDGMDIERSEDPKMKELKESLGRVDALERNFYVANSSPKGGKGNNSVVEKVNVDGREAIQQAEQNAKTEQLEKSQVER